MAVWVNEMSGTGVTLIASVLNPGMEGLMVSDLRNGDDVALWTTLAGTQFGVFSRWERPPDPTLNFPYGYDVSPD